MATTRRPKAKHGGNGRAEAGWDAGQTENVAAAAVAGAAVGLAANMGRKLFVQFASTGGVRWDEALANEHRMVLALFDKIEATSDDQASHRADYLFKLKYLLTKHALEEENVVYPALRQANIAHDADALEGEHGYVKTYLYELETTPKDGAEWLARARDFRAMLEEHMRMEEEQVFPALRDALGEAQASRLTTMVHREGASIA